jgi:hypothetical protein
MKLLAALVAVLPLVSTLATNDKRKLTSINPDPATLHIANLMKPVSSLETSAKHLQIEFYTRGSQGIFTV